MPLCYEGKLSLYCFVGTSILILLCSMPLVYLDNIPNIWGAILWGPFFYYMLINMVIRFVLRDYLYQIAIRASFLGFIFSVSILLVSFAPSNWKAFGIYGSFLALFHYTEFLGIAWSNPATLSTDSFMLNHSWHYAIAAVLSWVEFSIETILFPEMKVNIFSWMIGITLCIFGEVLRKLAMITATTSFNHLVQYVKRTNHKLITNGVYGYIRHPSYVGWFWWSIGTQIILSNPICVIIYTIASWKFFKDRIFIEEITLLNFFGTDYFDYQSRVPTGLPFIKGYTFDHVQ